MIEFLDDEETRRSIAFNTAFSKLLNASETQQATRILVENSKFRAFEYKLVRDEFEIDDIQAARISRAEKKCRDRFASLRHSERMEKAYASEALAFAQMLRVLEPDQADRFLRYAFALKKNESLTTLLVKLDDQKDQPVRRVVEELTDRKASTE
ncbi:MAG: hypothetical protein WBD20_01235 [Pirellulaceae bacterium]